MELFPFPGLDGDRLEDRRDPVGGDRDFVSAGETIRGFAGIRARVLPSTSTFAPFHSGPAVMRIDPTGNEWKKASFSPFPTVKLSVYSVPSSRSNRSRCDPSSRRRVWRGTVSPICFPSMERVALGVVEKLTAYLLAGAASGEVFFGGASSLFFSGAGVSTGLAAAGAAELVAGAAAAGAGAGGGGAAGADAAGTGAAAPALCAGRTLNQ